MSGRKQPATGTVRAADVPAQWGTLLDQVSKHDVHMIVENDGAPVAVIISSEDLKRLQQYETEREADFKVIDEIRAAFKDAPDEELEREVNRAFWGARERRRAEAKAPRVRR